MPNSVIDIHFHLLAYIYPMCNALVLALCVWGAVRTPLRRGFLIMKRGDRIGARSAGFHCTRTSEGDFGVVLIVQPWERFFAQFAMIATWLAVIIHITGVWILVRDATRMSSAHGFRQ